MNGFKAAKKAGYKSFEFGYESSESGWVRNDRGKIISRARGVSKTKTSKTQTSDPKNSDPLGVSKTQTLKIKQI